MAGYMTKLQGYVYNGSFKSKEALANGVFAVIDAGEVKAVDAKKATTVLRVAEKTDLWGMNALILDVASIDANEIFFVENEWDVDTTSDYDTAKYTLPVGKFVRMHRILPGEQLIMTVDEELFGTANVGDLLCPTTAGTVVAVA